MATTSGGGTVTPQAVVTPPTAPIMTTTPAMASLLTKIIRSEVIATLRTGRSFIPPQGIDFNTYPGPGHNDTYVLASYNDLPLDRANLANYNLAEGVTPSAEAFGSDVNEFSTVEKARVVTFTDEQVRTNPHGFAGIVADKVRNAALDIIDAVAGSIWAGYAAAGVPKFSPGATPLPANAMDAAAIVKAIATLRMLGVEPLDGENYGCLILPTVASTLMLNVQPGDWVDSIKYAAPDRLLTGEIGQYRGVRFFSNPRILPSTGAVIPSFFFGKHALAWADLTSLRVTSVSPTPVISDPLGQRGAAGFRVRTGGRFIHDVQPGTDNKRFRVVVCESTPTVVVAV